ncbi:unnamed protein product [Rhodiola kirilowii]
MEFQFFSFPMISTFALFILFCIAKLVKNNSYPSTNLPPGPWKLPFIGNLHQLASSAPHRRLRDLANKYGPLMHLQLGEVSIVIVSSPDMAKAVMKTHDIKFASRPQNICSRIISYNTTNIAFAPYGEYWRNVRKICTQELLTTKRVLSLRPIREEEMANLNKFALSSEGNPINFTEKIISTMFRVISRAAIGGQLKDMGLLVSAINEAAKIAIGFNPADFFPSISFIHSISRVKAKMEAAHKEIDRILGNVIREHELSLEGTSDTEVNEDLVHVLLKLKNDVEFPLKDSNIKAIILDILGAASDTSAKTVDWAMSELLKNPIKMEKVQEEVRRLFDKTGDVDESEIHKLKYLNLVIKEVLRLHPPAPLLLPRESREKCVINGYTIPSNTQVLINGWALGRDPKYWDEAEKFNPERFLNSSIQFNGNDFEYIPFGAGRRICPGIAFGLTNVEYFLANLLFHFDWKLPNGMKEQDIDMTEAFGATMGRKHDLLIVPTVHTKSVLAR